MCDYQQRVQADLYNEGCYKREKESEYYEENCKIGVQKAQNTRNW